MSIEFKPWPKIARLNRTIFITEKLDVTLENDSGHKGQG